ncbi:hypothetical protein E4U15_002005 [Claviceps sp. LM218 group G6]|nr:hypothetical protein E4U15_002005 [Claviceps sp. LM218 group G6]
MARLVTPPALEGVWEVCLSIFNIGATNPQRHAQNNNTVTTENLEKSIEKAVQKALPREGPHGRKWLRKGTSISSTVSGRSPVEIVEAVNAALKSEVAVAARRLQSGDTVITFRDSSSRPKTEDWVQTAFGPDATVVVKGLPVRLSEHQDREDIRKRLAAANGPGIVRATARTPNGTATRSPLIIGVDSLEAANRLLHSWVIYNSEIFEAEPFRSRTFQ